MKTETIKATFTNLLFVIGVVLVIYGFVQGLLTGVRIASFDKYPLNSYEETRCEMSYPEMVYTTPSGIPNPDEKMAINQEQMERQKTSCLNQVDYERKVRKTEHIATSVATLIAGSVLIFSFRRFIFR